MAAVAAPAAAADARELSRLRQGVEETEEPERWGKKARTVRCQMLSAVGNVP